MRTRENRFTTQTKCRAKKCNRQKTQGPSTRHNFSAKRNTTVQGRAINPKPELTTPWALRSTVATTFTFHITVTSVPRIQGAHRRLLDYGTARDSSPLHCLVHSSLRKRVSTCTQAQDACSNGALMSWGTHFLAFILRRDAEHKEQRN
jgi:hypothetical protein